MFLDLYYFKKKFVFNIPELRGNFYQCTQSRESSIHYAVCECESRWSWAHHWFCHFHSKCQFQLIYRFPCNWISILNGQAQTSQTSTSSSLSHLPHSLISHSYTMQLLWCCPTDCSCGFCATSTHNKHTHTH